MTAHRSGDASARFLFTSAQRFDGSLFPGWLCLMMAKQGGAYCATDDVLPRHDCERVLLLGTVDKSTDRV